ncbi:MAG: tail fiber protein [Chromatiales bacterium]
MTAASYCPRGYAEAAGQIIAISDNQALFAVIGASYGGDGRTTFAVPDLRGRSAVGLGTGPGLGRVIQGQRRGAEMVTLQLASMPAHTHAALAVNDNGDSVAKSDTWPANPVGNNRGAPIVSNAFISSGTTVTLNSGVIGDSGGDQPFENLPPQLGMRYCIATTGIFPPRD